MPFSLKHLSKAASSAGVGRPAPVPALTIPFAPARNRGVDHGPVRTHVRDDDVDAWQRLKAERVDSVAVVYQPSLSGGSTRPCRRRRRRPNEASVASRLNSLDAIRGAFRDVARGENRVVQHDRDAAAGRGGVRGDANGIDHVELSVVSGHARGRPHRASEHDRRVSSFNVRFRKSDNLLDRVRAVADDHAISPAVDPRSSQSKRSRSSQSLSTRACEFIFRLKVTSSTSAID